ncbi:hypothetical protein TNCV_1703621 [Trichonephila clavipes]|nr:hypothetical protein TNCV_1703621 [Trichonephila clavipes]
MGFNVRFVIVTDYYEAHPERENIGELTFWMCLVYARLEKRIEKVILPTRRATVCHIVENLNLGATENVSERSVQIHCTV